MNYCAACGARLDAQARFCHKCGTPVGSGARPNRLPWLVAATAVVALLVVLAAVLRTPPGEQSPSANAPFAGGAPSGGPPDLTSMTPREAADRLFDRVARAAENDDSAEARRFAPMAIQAYGMLGPLDPDARLHLGMIHLAAGDAAAALVQSDSLDSEYPGHLFVAILEARAHERLGQTDSLRAAYRAFLENEARERAVGRQEYADHQALIDRFAAEARTAGGS